VSKTIIGSSVTLWVLPRPGIKEWQRSKIHRRGPHPLEPGSKGNFFQPGCTSARPSAPAGRSRRVPRLHHCGTAMAENPISAAASTSPSLRGLGEGVVGEP